MYLEKLLAQYVVNFSHVIPARKILKKFLLIFLLWFFRLGLTKTFALFIRKFELIKHVGFSYWCNERFEYMKSYVLSNMINNLCLVVFILINMFNSNQNIFHLTVFFFEFEAVHNSICHFYISQYFLF